MANNDLTNAKRAKNDEFYTQYNDIQKEIEAYFKMVLYVKTILGCPFSHQITNPKSSSHKKANA